MKNRFIVFVLGLILFISILVGCIESQQEPVYATMEISSSAFNNNGLLPEEYTCDGDDISPPLSFGKIPDNATSMVLIVDDPDAPMGTFVHWLVWNIPSNITGFSKGEKIPYPQGINDFGNIGYNGPCPPIGSTHHYYFKIYALDTILDLKEGADVNDLTNAMSGHVLAEGQIMGKYGR